MLNLDEDFKKYFPKENYKLKDFQKKVILNAVERDNTLCIMPTGGGKSTIYWMSALELHGVTLVVSPLTALISEQAAKLSEQGYEILVLHSGISPNKQMELLINFANSKISPNFIFASPEKFATDGLFEYCLKQRKNDIKLLVIDEVHCVSQWGISFRPFYKRIPDFLDRVFGSGKWTRILALTATLNPLELRDICDSFHISKDNIVKETMLMRNEIQLHTMKFPNEDAKEEKFWKLLKIHQDEKTLVYVYRKLGERGVEGMCKKALELGYKAAWFHGEMSASERMDLIQQYKNGDINLVFATNAFGMGIDINDIRCVIHFMIPESAEQYYQEVGRAARDSHGANAYLLYSDKNIDVKRKYFIDQSFPTEEKLRESYKKVGNRKGYRGFPYFDYDDDTQMCIPYYLECGLIKIVCKGFSGLKELREIDAPELKQYYESTKGKSYMATCDKNGISPEVLSDKVYGGLVAGKLKLNKPLERWLVIEVADTEISDKQMQIMLENIEDKRKYKHELLDYFVYLIEDNPNTQYLHQEIARYLGMDKYQLYRIYTTADGNRVRSKSEVIICNLLYEAGIKYKYEELLEYEPGKVINPDFTIYLSNKKKLFWEHIGMLGNEEYDANWVKKLDIYNKLYPGQLIKTYEGGALTLDVKDRIEEIKKML